MRVEQRVEGTRSVVDFHALVDNELVALVEAESPNVMDTLGELQTQNAFEVRWTAGSRSPVSRMFSKVGLEFLIRE